MTRLSPQPWMAAAEPVLDALEAAGGPGCVRFVGGCVRNALMDQPVGDVDLATTLTPEAVLKALEAARLRAVPTGIEHGTVTAVVGGRPFEITTLRRDVATDGRRAVVAFTDDWAEDAARRDFRLNALYADRTGQVFDPTGAGIADARAGRIVFVGEPEARIREDYLRILRFFRFMAWYGRGAPDAVALAACAALAEGVGRLSAERVSAELLKLLAAPDPRPAVREMRAAGVLARTLPDVVADPGLFEAMVEVSADPVLRLSALLPEDPAIAVRAARALRLSNAETARLEAAADAGGADVDAEMDRRAARAAIYRLGPARFRDRLAHAWAARPEAAPAARALMAYADWWTPPKLPVGGREAAEAGLAPGPAVGQVLRALEDWWVANDFPELGVRERLQALAAEAR